MTDTYKTLVRRTPWPPSASRPVGTPIQPTTVYAFDTPDLLDQSYDGDPAGYVYAREGHPNADVLAAKIDSMEGVEGGFITSSGMSAVTAPLFGLLKAGDHMIGSDQLYGRSMRMLGQELPRFGITTSSVDTTDAKAVEAAIRPETRMILIEIVSNPTLRVADIEGIIALARPRGILVAVDNTFTTPRGLRPYDLGADVVIHSVTKLLAGHSDVTLGYVSARDPAHRTAIYDMIATLGLTASPFDCWLAERGLYSFDLRYDRSEENAKALAEGLAGAPGMKRVIYPGRPDHPDHNRAVGLLGSRTGNMLSFEIEGGRETANRFTKACANIPFAPTLGDIGSTLSHPISSSHRAVAPELRAKAGISEGFFRLSVGTEPAEVLLEELLSALKEATGAGQ